MESAGNIEPDVIIQEGIKELQRKLAVLLHGLGEADGTNGENGDYDGPRSPDANMDGGGWQADGYTTPYGNGGNQSAWGGGGGTTPYGQTPYGNSGQGGWGS